MATQIKLRRDTYQNWYDVNPVLADGEPGYDLTNKKLKIGDGSTLWRALPYFDDKETPFGSVNQDILPDEDVTRYLGSPSKRWHTLYVGPGTVDIGGVTLSANAGTLVANSPIISTGGLFKRVSTLGTGAEGIAFINPKPWNGEVVKTTDWATEPITGNPIRTPVYVNQQLRVTAADVNNSNTVTLLQEEMATPIETVDWFTYYKGVYSSQTTYAKGEVVTFSSSVYNFPRQTGQPISFAAAKRSVTNVNPNTVTLDQYGNGETDDWYISWYNVGEEPWTTGPSEGYAWHPEFADGTSDFEVNMVVTALTTPPCRSGWLHLGMSEFNYSGIDDTVRVTAFNGNTITLDRAVTIPSGTVLEFAKERFSAGPAGIVLKQGETYSDIILRGPTPASGITGRTYATIIPVTPGDASVPTPNTIPIDDVYEDGALVAVDSLVAGMSVSLNGSVIGTIANIGTISGTGWSYSTLEINVTSGGPYAWADLQGYQLSIGDPGFDLNIYKLMTDNLDLNGYCVVTNKGQDYDSNDLPEITINPNFAVVSLPTFEITAITDGKIQGISSIGGTVAPIGGRVVPLVIEDRPEYDASIGDWESLTSKPQIPTDVADLTDNSNLLGGGGATYDQSLNTTDIVTFNEINSTALWQNSVTTVSPARTLVPGATPTVVFSAPNWFTSFKLVIAVEGQLDGDDTFVDHTQTCEATIAATFNTTAEPIMSVYGIVYTSPAPLATFTVARNGGNIEVTATNSQTTNNLDVRVQAIQFVSRYD